MPAQDVLLVAEFELATYAINIPEVENGTVTADATEAIELTKVDDFTYTFAMPASAVNVNATFVEDQNTAIMGIEADGRQGVRYVNPMGQVSDRPFPGINIVIDGDKTYKVVK